MLSQLFGAQEGQLLARPAEVSAYADLPPGIAESSGHLKSRHQTVWNWFGKALILNHFAESRWFVVLKHICDVVVRMVTKES